jgi:hypothetical protein
MPKKKEEEKRPLDLTTDEAMEQLFPKEVVDHLKHVVRDSDEKKRGKNVSAKSSRKRV